MQDLYLAQMLAFTLSLNRFMMSLNPIAGLGYVVFLLLHTLLNSFIIILHDEPFLQPHFVEEYQYNMFGV